MQYKCEMGSIVQMNWVVVTMYDEYTISYVFGHTGKNLKDFLYKQKCSYYFCKWLN